jgi:ParB/RepB/Spo0J family partition protein
MRKGLGKGLGALLDSENILDGSSALSELRINDVIPNTGQPRKRFDQDKLKGLAESIKKHGVVQPIIVKRESDGYSIVAGERRWRAARIAGLKTIPAIVKDMSSLEIMETALVENIQREDLNPIEEAEAYQKLINEHGLTQENISKLVGKSRAYIANSVRLLSLSEKNPYHEVNVIGAINEIPSLIEEGMEMINLTFLKIFNLGVKPTYDFNLIAEKPGLYIPALIMVIIAVATTFISSKISMAKTMSQNDSNSQANQTGKTMMYFGPLMTLLISFQAPLGLSFYWTISNVFQIIQQIFTDKYMHKKKEG